MDSTSSQTFTKTLGAKRNVISRKEKIEEVVAILWVFCGGGDEFLYGVHNGHGVEVGGVVETGGWIWKLEGI